MEGTAVEIVPLVVGAGEDERVRLADVTVELEQPRLGTVGEVPREHAILGLPDHRIQRTLHTGIEVGGDDLSGTQPGEQRMTDAMALDAQVGRHQGVVAALFLQNLHDRRRGVEWAHAGRPVGWQVGVGRESLQKIPPVGQPNGPGEPCTEEE